jgi:acetylornithine deacetylase/succinyl-diaminopimelate desuccinylase-like protein
VLRTCAAGTRHQGGDVIARCSATAALVAVALTTSVPAAPPLSRLHAQPPATGSTTSGSALRTSIHAWRRANERQILDEAFALFALPNIAADSIAIRRVAAHLVAEFSARGFASALLESPSGGPPAVFAERTVPGATRTIVLYAHYDGQPVAGAPWDGDPFAPVLRRNQRGVAGEVIALPAPGDSVDPEARIYARSASDDKGPIVAMLAAFDALAALQREPSVNLKIFLEGEEEAGSQHLGDLLRAHREKLTADAWFFMDGPVHVSGAPQIVLGVRGVVSVEITLYGPNRPLHSGHYGNWAPNPAVAAAHLITSMRSRDGDITIAGFHDDVRAATMQELGAARALSLTDDSVRTSLGLSATEAQDATLAERIMRPALNVRGIRAGGVGGSATNAVPTSATISIDFRLVPDQEPARLRDIVNAHIRAQGYDVITDANAAATRADRERVALVQWGDGYRSVRASFELPVVTALQQVMRDAYGRAPLVAPTLGGSLPLFHFADVFDAPLITLPTVNSDNNQHAPNENLRLGNLWDGIALIAALVTELDAAWPARAVVP